MHVCRDQTDALTVEKCCIEARLQRAQHSLSECILVPGVFSRCSSEVNISSTFQINHGRARQKADCIRERKIWVNYKHNRVDAATVVMLAGTTFTRTATTNRQGMFGITALLALGSLFLRTLPGSAAVRPAQHLGERRAGALPPGLTRRVEPRTLLLGSVWLRSRAGPIRLAVLRLRTHFNHRVSRPR